MTNDATTEATETVAEQPTRKPRHQYRNANDQRIWGRGYTAALEDVLDALNAGGVKAARAMIAEREVV